ncbi:hypothetical protein BP6252_13950 [Coleophoma cylindrospora]|uniref:NB-ARC domain-containing protein n=1 Tax=Coleophoma cylindrospora TaxID=1849047 RepID=A0A3D8Q5P2_9HELO|nr:hypothetical protein BP6252_13950 [Coleophoma cylindrospora]
MGKLKALFKGRKGHSQGPDGPVGDRGTSNDGASSPQSALAFNPKSSDPATLFPDGIEVWHKCPNAAIDICFIHGLTGNRNTTWTASNQSTPWPTTLLSPKLPSARLLTWGYDAYVVRKSVASKNRLIDHATNLLNDLTIDREENDASYRPVIFVVHSLGGLVCKEAIMSSRNNPEPHLRTIFDHTAGIIFMGTPHRGSWMADWMKIPVSGLGILKSTNKSLLQILETDDQLLESIQVRFGNMIRELRESGRRLELTCFFEEQSLPLVGKVVSKDSATLEGYTSVSVHANHSNMVKFKTADETGFKRLLGDLKRWEKRSKEGKIKLEDTEASVGGIAGAVNATREPCYSIPFPENPKFVGQAAILDEIEEKFFVHKECQKIAIVGLGGIGKTQVALRFAFSVKETKAEYSIFWVAALSEANFEKAYVEIASELGVVKKSDNDDIKDLVRRHLGSEKAGKWLLVMDNADDRDLLFGIADKDGIYKYLPESESGLVLFTTRSREVAVEVAGADIIDLEQMSHADASRFLKSSLGKKQQLETEETITKLLRELAYLPLAISQASAYLNKNQLSIRKYLDLLQSTEEDLVSLMSREFYDGTRYRESHNAVATTWLVSFDQIRRSDHVAASLLAFVSCIEPKAIPQSIFPTAESKEALENAIGTLRGYAFLEQRGDDKTFDMHALVHMATRVWLQNEGLLEQTKSDAIFHLNEIFPSSDRVNRDRWREYMPHAVRALKGSSEGQLKERYDLFFAVGVCLDMDRRFKEAIRCFEATFEWETKQFPEDGKSRLTSEHALGSAYLGDRRIKDAIKIFEHVVAVQKRTLVEEDHSRLNSEHELARAYLEDRRIKDAIKIFEHVVAVQEKTLAEEDYTRLASEHELARAYLEDRWIKDAIKIFEHVVAVQKNILAEEDRDRLVSEHGLARAYLDDRRIKDTINILEHVLAVEKKTLAEEDHDRLTSEQVLATAYLNNRQTEDAIELLEHVVAVRKHTLLEEDHERLTSEHELARAYLVDRRIKDAIKIFEHVVAVRETTLVEEDYDRLASEHELARAYLDDGRIKDAIKIFEHVIAVQKNILAEEDHSRLNSEHELARAYLDDGQVQEAIRLLEHVVAVDKSLFAEVELERLVSVDLLTIAKEKLQAGYIAS